jgi:uncharacterized membrane-anchored protein YjiN (DUF445 family)
MKKSELYASIREMIINELSEAENPNPKAAGEYADEMERAADEAERMQKALSEEEQIDEMAKIAGDLKSAIEKVIQANADAEKKDVRKAIKADDEVVAALGDEDLFDNQLNKFIDLVRGEREVGQRGRKASEKPEGEPKEKGTRGRPQISYSCC